MEKIKGFCYLNCNSNNLMFAKDNKLWGTILIEENKLSFLTAKQEKQINNLEIYLSEIDYVKIVGLNSFEEYGLLIHLKNDEEYVVGSKDIHKLKDLILDRRRGIVAPPKFKKNKLAIFICILCSIFMIFSGVLFVTIISHYSQEIILETMVDEIDTMDIYTDSIDMELETTGDYAYVEKTIKEFYSELFINKVNYSEYNAPAALTRFGTTEYLEKNKNNLDITLEEIDTYFEKSDAALENIIDIINIDNTMARIEKYDLDDYYIDLYYELIVYGSEEELIAEWRALRDENIKKFAYIKEMVTILKDNPDDWYIGNDSLYISDEEILNYYNERYNYVMEDNDLQIPSFDKI